MPERSFSLCVLDADIENDVVGANRSRREQRAVDYEVRPGLHQRAILETQRLALGAVREHNRVSRGALGDRSPLAADREAGAPSAEEAAGLQLGDQLAGWKGGPRPEALTMRRQAVNGGRARHPLPFLT